MEADRTSTNESSIETLLAIINFITLIIIIIITILNYYIKMYSIELVLSLVLLFLPSKIKL